MSYCVCVHFCVRVSGCTRYFPASSTQEMLDEWRPLLCVFDVIMQKAVSYMELFLPTIMPPEEHAQGFRCVCVCVCVCVNDRNKPVQ